MQGLLAPSPVPAPNGGSSRQPVEPVTPNPDLCRGLQAPLLLIKISEDFEKETIRPEGLGRPQLLSQGRRTRHSFLLALQGTESSSLCLGALWTSRGPTEKPGASQGIPTRDQQGSRGRMSPGEGDRDKGRQQPRTPALSGLCTTPGPSCQAPSSPRY